jgi:ubiquinone biosynthesis protein COQ9
MAKTLSERIEAFNNKLEQEKHEKEVIESLKAKVLSSESKEAIQIASELADMIIFHANVKENAKKMSEVWEM